MGNSNTDSDDKRRPYRWYWVRFLAPAIHRNTQGDDELTSMNLVAPVGLTAARLERTAMLKREAGRLRQDFADAPYWRTLATEHGVRLPAWYVPGNDGRPIRRAARQLGINSTELESTFGVRTSKALAELNPQYPAWAVIGLLLEIVAQRACTLRRTHV